MGQGVPDDFIEEAKAVTDGHVVFLDDAVKAFRVESTLGF